MKRFRASYSILSAWESGQYQRAVEMYFGIGGIETDAMRQGKLFHERWAEHTLKTGCLPLEFGGKKLVNPKPELNVVAELTPWLDLSGFIDCLDGSTIYEYKTGSTESSVYANGWQVYVYQLLAKFVGQDTNLAFVMHHDQYLNRQDTSIVHLTPETLRSATEWVLTNSHAMHTYLLRNNLYRELEPHATRTALLEERYA